MRTLILPLLVIFNIPVSSQIIDIRLLPPEKVFRSYYADAVTPQFSLSKHMESAEWFGNIGNSFPLADVKFYSVPMQFSAGAAALSTIIKTPGHIQVYTVDYLVEFYCDLPLSENTALRLLLGHLSAHYADDGITELNFHPINYVRDYAGLHLQQKLVLINGRVYAGINYNFHNEPEDKQVLIQAGAEGEHRLSEIIAAYAALDFKMKSEVNYGSTQSYQIGLRLNGSTGTAFRLAFIHRRGFEERGQLYDRKDIKNSIGFYFDF